MVLLFMSHRKLPSCGSFFCKNKEKTAWEVEGHDSEMKNQWVNKVPFDYGNIAWNNADFEFLNIGRTI